MNAKVLVLSLFLASPLFGQTAKVVALSPEDAAQAKSLDEQQKELDKRKSDFEEKIRDTYLFKEVECNPRAFITYVVCPDNLKKPTKAKLPADGWSYGFEYSEDFKYIVPKQPTSYSNPWNSCLNLTASPAIGTMLVCPSSGTVIVPGDWNWTPNTTTTPYITYH